VPSRFCNRTYIARKHFNAKAYLVNGLIRWEVGSPMVTAFFEFVKQKKGKETANVCYQTNPTKCVFENKIFMLVF
jgi:hypothetical protein